MCVYVHMCMYTCLQMRKRVHESKLVFSLVGLCLSWVTNSVVKKRKVKVSYLFMVHTIIILDKGKQVVCKGVCGL